MMDHDDLIGAVREGLCFVIDPGVADVTLTFDPGWDPSMIVPEMKASLGFAEVN